jgi:hypothetical protein
MKLSAITSRSLEKDYVDLYKLLQSRSLKDALTDATVKIPELDHSVILKALVYFDDVECEHTMFKKEFRVKFDTVQDFLRTQVKTFLDS